MQFQILDSVDPKVIEISSSSLDSVKIEKLSQQALPILGRLSVNRFAFLMSNLASLGGNFSNNLKLISEYFSCNRCTNELLVLEDLLHKLFVKKYETETVYNDFYGLVQKFYPAIWKPEIKTEYNRKKIIFFVHNPVFLAHTNALFRLLESKCNKNIEVSVYSLRYNVNFALACQRVNADFNVLKADKLSEAYLELADYSRNSLALVWVSVPVHLAYVSQYVDNAVLWTHKFHPDFSNTIASIGTDRFSKSHFTFFGKEWLHFDAGFSIDNINKKPNSWENRKLKFGSICREELIDNEEHWSNVHLILKQNPALQYFYCGRQPKHAFWCAKFEIDCDRVSYLGWLSNPEEKVREMMFLLDGPKLGHGVIAIEALCAGVPILSPASSTGNYRGILERGKESLPEEEINFINRTIFQSEHDLTQLADELCNKDKNEYLGDICVKISRYVDQKSQSFDEFVDLINSKRI